MVTVKTFYNRKVTFLGINMFNAKLKEERKRLSLSQTDLGKACGVTKQAQIRYEKGERQPDSDYLQKAHKAGVDVSYLITGIRTQPVELPSDEALLLDSYRALDAEQKKMTLRFLLGGLEHLKNDENDDDDANSGNADSNNKNSNNVDSNNVNSNNTNSNNTNSNNTNSNNTNSNNTGSNNTNSNNSNVLNSFNQSGFTELPFIYACGFCGAMAWLLGALASWKAATDMAVSMSFGQVALILWAMAIMLAIFGCNIGMKKYNKVQAELGSHA